jgi:SAM-dependent methyltransferase
MEHQEAIKEYWNIRGQKSLKDTEDHWVDEFGKPLSDQLFVQIATYLLKIIGCEEKSDSKILEVGCGTGRILSKINQLAPKISLFGTDISEIMIEKARRRVPSAKLIAGDILESQDILFDSNQKYDLIYIHSVTQYFPNNDYFDSFLIKLFTLIGQNGKIVLIDVPTTWFQDEGTKIIKQELDFTSALKIMVSNIKRVIRRKFKIAPRSHQPGHSFIDFGGEVVRIPNFYGYFVDPDKVVTLCSNHGFESEVCVQMFTAKPLDYRKYRPNFVITKVCTNGK